MTYVIDDRKETEKKVRVRAKVAREDPSPATKTKPFIIPTTSPTHRLLPHQNQIKLPMTYVINDKKETEKKVRVRAKVAREDPFPATKAKAKQSWKVRVRANVARTIMEMEMRTEDSMAGMDKSRCSGHGKEQSKGKDCKMDLCEQREKEQQARIGIGVGMGTEDSMARMDKSRCSGHGKERSKGKGCKMDLCERMMEIQKLAYRNLYPNLCEKEGKEDKTQLKKTSVETELVVVVQLGFHQALSLCCNNTYCIHRRQQSGLVSSFAELIDAWV